VITSVRNPKVARALRLHKRTFRDTDRAFLVEGAQAVGEALGTPGALEVLFHTEALHPLLTRAREAGADLVGVSDDVMARLTGTVTPPGLVGVAPFVDVGLDELPESTGCVAILHAVRDPGNAGTVLRSADAAGADAVVFSTASVDVYNAKTVRASAGSLFHVPIVRGVDTPAAIDSLRGRGVRILAMDAGGRVDLFDQDLSRPVAFVFGNEAWGLPEDVARLADDSVRVPIVGRAESLNLAAAASVCLFEWARRHREDQRVSLESLIAAAAHDIRSPLTAMKGFGHALATRWEEMTPEQRDLMLRGIVYDTDRLNTILRQLVDAARLSAGSLELFPERTDIGALVERIALSLGRDPDHPPVEWTSGEVVALVDADRLQTILEGYIGSLVWWTDEGPVRISATVEGERLVLRACRDGARIGPEDADRLFGPRDAGTGGGSKIGLFVARGIAEAQGGRAFAEVGPGAGGSLCLVLDVPVGGVPV
jgi:TrmH family RNA methyltransferase